MSFKDKTFLVTGGAGSIGSALCVELLKHPVKALRILDIDEYGLFNIQRKIQDSRVRFLLGNIQDKDRLKLALKGVDIVIHAGALKNLAITEYNAPEVIKTNVFGCLNLIECSLETQPEKFLFISSDKAVNLASLYSATKLLGERMVLWAHLISDGIALSSCRFPNVIETKGNVFETWEIQHKSGQPLTVTDKNMYRYFMHLDQAVDFILKSLSMMKGGEIFVPANIERKSVLMLAQDISDRICIIGVREGEVLDEVLMTDAEKARAERVDDIWVIR